MKTVNDNYKEITGRSEKKPIYVALIDANVFSQLDGAILSTDSTLTVDDGTNFPDEGAVRINDELIIYRSKSGNDLQSLERGTLASTAAGHADDDKVRLFSIFTTHPVAARESDALFLELLNPPSGATQSIEPQMGVSSISGISFEILDNLGQFTTFLQTNNFNIRDKQARILIGYEDLTEDEYEIDFLGFVKSMNLNNELDTYKISCGDVMRFMNKQLVLGQTLLNGSISAGATTIVVDSTNNFEATNGTIQIDDEIITYTGTTSTSFTGCTRGQFGTSMTTHDDDAEVTEIFQVTGHVIDLLLQFLTSTGLGTNGVFDVFPAEKGLGIDQNLIDVTEFTFERDNFFVNWTFNFDIKETVDDPKTFFEEQFLKPLNAHFRVRADGKLSFKVSRAALPTESQVTVNEDNIIDKPTWNSNLKSVINQIEIRTNKDIIDDKYKRRDLFQNATSQTNNGVSPAFIMELDGVSGAFEDLIIGEIERNTRRRFQNPAVEISCKAFFDTHLIEVGDIVNFNHPSLPNEDDGRGIVNGQYEVIDRRPNFKNGNISLTLLNTNRSGKFCVIAPDVSKDSPPDPFPDYIPALLAAGLDVNYAFISLDTGKMTNGDPGCLIF